MNADLEIIDALKKEWDALQPMATENEKRLWKKLRLEWNYHSNHIEGNTLTYGETELLLLHDQTHGNHTFREYEEMKAHDVGIAHLLNLAGDKTRLIAESDIRDLNKLILKEPFWKPAQTFDGQMTRKQIIPGEYKTFPNNVLTATGELFEFAAPSDVPGRMQSLVQWLETALPDENASIFPILAKLHHDFVLIHPFDDGNGRVARMLVNYALLRQGYPPIVVPTERKKDYLSALRLADVGEIAELENFLTTCAIRSLELGIKASKGESLDEPGDVEKNVAIFIKNQLANKRNAITRSPDAIREIYETCLKDIIQRVRTKLGKLAPLFESFTEGVHPARTIALATMGPPPEDQIFQFLEKTHDIIVEWHLKGFCGNAPKVFGVTSNLRITLKEYEYLIAMNDMTLAEKNYADIVSSGEAEGIAESILADAFTRIKSLSQTNDDE